MFHLCPFYRLSLFPDSLVHSSVPLFRALSIFLIALFPVFPLSSSFCSLTLAEPVYYDSTSFTFCSPAEDVCTYVRTYTYKWMYTYMETAVHRSHAGEYTELASHIFEGRYRHSVATFR